MKYPKTLEGDYRNSRRAFFFVFNIEFERDRNIEKKKRKKKKEGRERKRNSIEFLISKSVT